MDSLLIFKERSVRCIPCDKSDLMEELKIRRVKNGIQLNKGKLNVFLEPMKSAEIGDIRLCLIKEDWHFTPLQEGTIGRSSTCFYCFQMPYVSKIHSRLEKEGDRWKIYDCDSTNGTYVNQHCIQQHTLRIGDEICCASIRLYFFGSFLLVNQRTLNTFVPECLQSVDFKSWEIQKGEFNVKHPILNIEIEAPVARYHASSPSLFSCMGSSLAILLSSLVMSAFMFVLRPGSEEQVQTMLLTSGSMCFAFLLFGFWNYFHQRKQQSEKLLERKQSYLNYLQQLDHKITELRHIFQTEEKMIQKKCLCFQGKMYGIKHPLWVGIEQKTWVSIRFPSINYQEREDELIQLAKTYKKMWKEKVNCNVFVQDKKNNFIYDKEGELAFFLFEQWIYQHPESTEKWIWIHPKLSKQSRVFSFSYCHQEDLFLWASNLEEWNVLKQHLDDKYTYTILSYEKEAYWNKQATWIYLDGRPAEMSQKQQLQLREILLHTKCKEVPVLMDVIQEPKWSGEKVCLSVPIGWKEDRSILMLDFNEDKHGPHGLIAGTTGSGKSEWLANVLMQLVLRNSSRHFQYILIDFKGGAFGQPFYQYPHCAGMVTNLEERSIYRWMISMEQEIQQRQKQFRQFLKEHPDKTAHIDIYNRFSEDVMSHLFLVFDEFAEFKSQYPEQAQKVKDMARIGRSLGIHLLIATQKPLGVVDEQIWSNSKFQVCLAVNSEADSREVIHDPRAANLDKAGQFILHINGKCWQGQSFWLQEKVRDREDPVWREWNKKCGYTEYGLERKNYLQMYTEWILHKKDKHRWILLPDLMHSDREGFARLDVPERHQQPIWTIRQGQKIVIFIESRKEQETFLDSLIAYYQDETIVLVGWQDRETYVDGILEEDDIQSPVATLIVCCTNEKDYQRYTHHSDLRLIFIVDRPWVGIHRLMDDQTVFASLGWTQLEWVQVFFNEVKVPIVHVHSQMGLLYEHGKFIYFYYWIRHPIHLGEKRIQLPLVQRFKIGRSLDSETIVYWKKKHPLLILYVQTSSVRWIEKRMESWMECNPLLSIRIDFQQSADVYILSIHEFQKQIDSQIYHENMYEFDVLWIGLGLSDYSYLIKRKCPYQPSGFLVYWTEQICVECKDE